MQLRTLPLLYPICRILNKFFSVIFIAITLISVLQLSARELSEYASSSVLSKGNWVRVKISETGIHKITKSDISAWGFTDLSKIRVFGYGGAPISEVLNSAQIDDLIQVPVIRNADKILFYAQSQDSWEIQTSSQLRYKQVQHPYALEACYFITDADGIEDLQMPLKKIELGTSTTPITTFTDRMYYEKELLTVGQTGRLLVGEDFKYQTSQTFKFTLTDYVPQSTVYATTAFVAKVMNGSATLNFKYNGTNLTQSNNDRIKAVTAPAYEHVNIAETMKSFTLPDENLSYTIGFTYTGTLFTAYLDYITINYTRTLALNKGKLAFRTSTNRNDRYTLSAVTADTRILDVTDITAPYQMDLVMDGASVTFSTRIPGEREMYAFNTTITFPSPTLVEKVKNQNIHGEECPNMVIITPPEFKVQADRVADLHRNTDGMTVYVYTPQQLYNEFSSGTPDFMAFRKMLKMFYDRGATESNKSKLGYLLLFGRSSYDNRQITDRVKKNAYPMLLNWESLVGHNENTSYNMDDILGFLDDNSGVTFSSDKLRIAIGRMPVKSVAEAKLAVDKLYRYVTKDDFGTWKNNVLMIADDEDNAIHMEQSEGCLSLMKLYGGENYVYNHIYTDAFIAESKGAGRIYPDARNKMFQKLSEGMLWVNYVGHANPVSWTHDGLLNLTDIQEKMYFNHYPLLYTATCEFTRWDDDEISGGELMYLNPRGGVIALMTASRVVYISDNGTLNKSVSKYIFKKDSDGKSMRIGDILMRGKNGISESNSNKLRYQLIGDPAMRLATPSYKLQLETINGETADNDNQPTIEARGSVEVAGSIYDEKGNLAADYNGIISTTLFDAESSITTFGYGKTGKEIVFYDRSNKLYVGQDSIKNGKFKLKIAMPSEINNNYSPAMFNFYSYNTQGAEGRGSSENLYVYGYNTEAQVDTEPPTFDYAVLNTTSFKNGDQVNESPMLIASFKDNFGINVSTSGIGHQMSVVLDEKTSFTNVAQYYTPIIGDDNGGTINYPLVGLTPGAHTLRLKVWDTSNNSSEITLEFNVVTGLQPEMYEVYTTSNPASVEANFYIKHNRPDALITVTLGVYDLSGREVWSTSETGKSDMFTSFPIVWNLNDNAGRRVSRGIYVYRAGISTDGIQETTKSKKIAVGASR